MHEKKTLTNVTGLRYRKAKKTAKTAILNEFCQSTGYNRKYAIGVLQHAGKTQTRRMSGKTVNVKITATPRKKRVYTPYYGEDVRKCVLALWGFFRQICAKRLVPMIRENLDVLFADKRLALPQSAKHKTGQISRSSVERFLKDQRAKLKIKGTCATKPGTLLKQQIPVRTFWHWDDKKPGFTEVDTVSHDGGFVGGEYAYTLSITDVDVCWSEFRALRNKARKWTLEAFTSMYDAFPLPIKGIDSDNGSEFINWHTQKWCEERSITFTRGRHYHKNDNAFVEQKNGDIIRKTIGYGRIEGENALAALQCVYDVMNPLYNFFYPNLKCIDKKQVGQRTKRIYEKEPKTPFQRVMESPDVPDTFKQKCTQRKSTLNIVDLQQKLDRALENLDRLLHHSPSSHGQNFT